MQGTMTKAYPEISRGRVTKQAARGRRNPEGRHDLLRIAASLVVDVSIDTPSSSLLALLATGGVAATTPTEIGSNCNSSASAREKVEENHAESAPGTAIMRFSVVSFMNYRPLDAGKTAARAGVRPPFDTAAAEKARGSHASWLTRQLESGMSRRPNCSREEESV